MFSYFLLHYLPFLLWILFSFVFTSLPVNLLNIPFHHDFLIMFLPFCVPSQICNIPVSCEWFCSLLLWHFIACPNRACYYKLRVCVCTWCVCTWCLFLTLSESQNGEVWLTINLGIQLSLEFFFWNYCQRIFWNIPDHC